MAYYQRPSAPPPNQQGYMTDRAVTQTNQTYQQYPPQGNKKALLIGINYIGSSNQLRGCINDVQNMQRYLIQGAGYNPGDIVMLTDDSREFVKQPTRDNMIRAMQWLVSNANPGDRLFFHYSGHGGEEKDLDGDEVDGNDECIYPVDFNQSGSIIDDVLHDILIKPLPAGCRLTAIFDSCHSGTVLDLPFTYRAQDGGIKEYNIWKDSTGDGANILLGYATRNTGMMFQGAKSLFNKVTNYKSGSQIEKIKQTKMSPADIVMISGCKDNQTSADANEAGSFTGAMSWAFLTAMSQLQPGHAYTYLTLLQTLRVIMSNKYTQKPQLSSGHQIDTHAFFEC